jgi:threonine synthase
VALVNSVNPLRLEGQKTAAFEVVEALGEAPTALVLPVGNAGNISAYHRGFREAIERGLTDRMPRLLGVQAAGAAPLATGRDVDRPETVASAIRIGRPASAALAREAVRDSGGAFLAVSDDEILHAYRELVRRTGVFAEPASAASIAGLMKLVQSGELGPEDRVVAVLTGHGLKDPDTARAVLQAQPSMRTVAPERHAIEDVLLEVAQG